MAVPVVNKMNETKLEIPYKILQSKDDQTIAFYLEDCKAGMQKFLKAKSADVVVTSPPYNIGLKYNSYQDKLSTDQYLQWIEDVSIEIKRVLKDNGSFFLNIGNIPSNQWIALSVANSLRNHFVLQNTIIWIKSISIGDFSVGHFKPVPGDRYLNNCYEFIFHFTKDGNVKLDKLATGTPYQDKSNIKRWKSTNNEDKRDRGNSWFIPYETIQNKSERGHHPSTFPIQLPNMCIELHGVTEKNRLVVLDPFCGIGSTAVACKKLGVSFVGFDINKEYLNEAITRVIKECHIPKNPEI